MSTKYGTARQLQDLKKTASHMEATAKDPFLLGSVADKPKFLQRKKQVEQQLAELAPPPLSVQERSSLTKRQEMLEAFIKLDVNSIKKPAMPSQHDMWNSSAGTRGRHRKWEHAIKNYTINPEGNVVPAIEGYGAHSEWKDNQRRLHYGEDDFDPDIANLETIRPQTIQAGATRDYSKLTFGSNASYREGYARTFPESPSQKANKLVKKPGRGPLTPEQKAAASAKMKAKWAARKAAAAQATQPQVTTEA